MLDLLHIRDLAIIDDMEIKFSKGLNVLTGETGAGKSILVGAVQLLLGSRANQTLVRKGAGQAIVEAVFHPGPDRELGNLMENAGLPLEDGEVVVKRIISKDGRSRAFINGSPCPARVLGDVCSRLVDISGQHQFQSLLDPENHAGFLDAFAGCLELRQQVANIWEELRVMDGEIKRLESLEKERVVQEDYLLFQIREIDALNLVAGEEDDLEKERNILRNSEKLANATRSAAEKLYEEQGSVSEILAFVQSQLEGLETVDATLTILNETIQKARMDIEDVASQLRSYSEKIEADPVRLDEIEARLEAISRLARKHGPTTNTILEKREELAQRLNSLSSDHEHLKELKQNFAALSAKLAKAAADLGKAREQAAPRLEKEITRALRSLAMPGAKLKVEIRPAAPGNDRFSLDGLNIGHSGAHQVEFLFGPNPGEGLKPLVKIASGGELSRTMLALKKVFLEVDSVKTYIFDEIDAGIGGEAAESVARTLEDVASRHQVLCVTHLPQIAARAGHHFSVSKEKIESRTVSRIHLLVDMKERALEISRMLSGNKVPRISYDYAVEILNGTERKKY
ncbi:MAG: DNA repair protein RecN [Deltaproteobacteria bacterium]|nr:DNA repair protein RecN [Deltaproteobacteria bacterium]